MKKTLAVAAALLALAVTGAVTTSTASASTTHGLQSIKVR